MIMIIGRAFWTAEYRHTGYLIIGKRENIFEVKLLKYDSLLEKQFGWEDLPLQTPYAYASL